MPHVPAILLAIGGVLLLSLVADAIGKRTPLPRVSLLLMFGIAVGPLCLNLLPPALVSSFDLVADMALLMVGFLLGQQFTRNTIVEHGREVLWISVAAVAITALIVLCALLALGVELPLALLLAGIAPATAPAATADVITEARAKGPFSSVILGIVALDDAWGLLLFSFCLAAATLLLGVGQGANVAASAGWEVGGALILGVTLGLPVAYLTGRIEPGEPTLAEALGVVFVCGGLALWLEVSFLLAAMALGAVVANLARHHTRPFNAIEHIEWPFMILFFVLAGASLEFAAWRSVAPVAVVYVVARVCGRLIGGYVGAVCGNSARTVRNWIGLALLPQAGVALGMALVASSRAPQFSETLLPAVIASTVIFELLGPVATRFALVRAGEFDSSSQTRDSRQRQQSHGRR